MIWKTRNPDGLCTRDGSGSTHGSRSFVRSRPSAESRNEIYPCLSFVLRAVCARTRRRVLAYTRVRNESPRNASLFANRVRRSRCGRFARTDHAPKFNCRPRDVHFLFLVFPYRLSTRTCGVRHTVAYTSFRIESPHDERLPAGLQIQ